MRSRTGLVISLMSSLALGSLLGLSETGLGLAVRAASLTEDFSKAEKGEAFPGGQATSLKSARHRNAFSNPSANMSFEKELDFKLGNALFRKVWVSAPASTKSSDGLGPLHNARSCQRCHLKDGRGHPPAANWPEDDQVSMFLRLSIAPEDERQKALLASHKLSVIPEPAYGTQLQDLAIQGHDAEGKMQVTYRDVKVLLSGGEEVVLRSPHYEITNLAYGPLHPKVMMSPRIAPQMIGLGLLEAVPEAVIASHADPEDQDADGISGRMSRIWSSTDQKFLLGRFGWKAGNPSIAQQSAGAFSGDMGLSSPPHPNPSGECTEKQAHCLGAPHGASSQPGSQQKSPTTTEVEVSQEMLDLVVFYASNLAVPKRRSHDASEILKGKALFHRVGCAGCHTPNFVTGRHQTQAHLSGQLIWPYTDLLLHDMGEGLADHRPEGVTTGREWRTAPLWGIGLTEIVSGHSFLLHDGRARTIQEAILWHGGEAKGASDGFRALSKEERARLIAFVRSL